MVSRWWVVVSRNWVVATLLMLASVQAGLLSWSAAVHSPTWDEVGHLAAGISHWKTGRFDLYAVNPPLVRVIAAAPVVFFDMPKMDWAAYRSNASVRSEVYLGRRMIELNGPSINRRFLLARLAIIPIALLGTVLCFSIANRAFGHVSGLVAATLWAFSPNVLGYGSVITPDLASAVVVLLVAYAFYFWLDKKDWGSAALLMMAVAVAMLVKSVWIFLPPTLAVAWLLSAAWNRWGSKVKPVANPESPKSRFLPATAFQMLLVQVGSLILVNSFYGFEGTFRPLGKFEFVSQSLSGIEPCLECGQKVGNRFSESWLAMVPSPLPANYLIGIDVQRRDFERGAYDPAWKSYLFGTWQQGGWWYFYFVGLFYKEPLAIWGLALLATLYAMVSPSSRSQKALMFSVLVPSLMLLAVVTANTGLNRYIRYALPLLPLLYIWISQLAKSSNIGVSGSNNETAKKDYSRSERIRSTISIAGCVAVAGGSLLYGPNWLSYFNMAAGGPENDYQILCDSNVDWGQDLPGVESWLEKHPEAKSNLKMAFFGSFDPASFGIKYQLPPKVELTGREPLGLIREIDTIKDGWYIVSKNYLVGHTMPTPDGRNRLAFETTLKPVYSYLKNLEPVDRIGNSMFVYRIDNDSRQKLAVIVARNAKESVKTAKLLGNSTSNKESINDRTIASHAINTH